jgi:hypothetical protein
MINILLFILFMYVYGLVCIIFLNCCNVLITSLVNWIIEIGNKKVNVILSKII